VSAARWKPLVAPGLATLAALALLIGLGVWQLQRLAWKEALIGAVAERARAAPTDLPPESDWPALNPADYEYRHVRLSGVYDIASQVLVFRALEQPRGRYGGQGYLVMTPLRLAGGAAVLVNRGFVPQDQRPQDQRPQTLAARPGQAVVTGLMRSSEPRNAFTPADDPARGQWYSRDVGAIAAALGLARAAPFSIDADAGAPGELPQGGETILAFPNNHLEYALTWFGLALALAGVFAAYAFASLRRAA